MKGVKQMQIYLIDHAQKHRPKISVPQCEGRALCHKSWLLNNAWVHPATQKSQEARRNFEGQLGCIIPLSYEFKILRMDDILWTQTSMNHEEMEALRGVKPTDAHQKFLWRILSLEVIDPEASHLLFFLSWF